MLSHQDLFSIGSIPSSFFNLAFITTLELVYEHYKTIYNILYVTFYSNKIPLFQIYSYYSYNFIKGFNLVQFLEMS